MLRKIWKFWSSLKPAGFIFSALVLSILLGSFVIQRSNAEDGQIERAYSPETVKLFEFFGLFDLFHSPWFAFLVLLLGVNVFCASVEMAPRHWKLFKKRDFQLPLAALPNQQKFSELKTSQKISEILDPLLASVKKNFAKAHVVHQSENGFEIFAEKQRYAYLGVYIVHLALLIIMAGGIRGAVDGFEGQMTLMEKESARKVYVRSAAKKNRVLPFEIYCHEIRIDTYEDGSPKDYFSDLEVIDQGKSVFRQTIQVNEPLTYQGISFYQASYGKQKVNVENYFALTVIDRKTGRAEELKLSEGEDIPLPGTKESVRFVSYNENPIVPTEEGPRDIGETLHLFKLTRGEPERVTVFKNFPSIDTELRPTAPETFVFKGKVEDYELKEMSGLQVAYDPGAPIVFSGCALLVLGIFWTFFTSHQKIWIVAKEGELLIAGKSYRDKYAFEKRFDALIRSLLTPDMRRTD